MDNGAGNCNIRNDCDFCIDCFENTAATGIKSHDRCSDACDECMGCYDASLLTILQFKPTITLISAVSLSRQQAAVQLETESADNSQGQIWHQVEDEDRYFK